MAEKGCWDINPGCGSGICSDSCPAFSDNIECWKYDWKAFFASMSLGDRKHWIDLLRERCFLCPVYEKHPKEIEAMLKSPDFLEYREGVSDKSRGRAAVMESRGHQESRGTRDR